MLQGTVLAGRFEVDDVAGVGGMGTVYRAHDVSSGEPVAIKVLHARAADELSRFEREAEILSEVAHPAVVRYLGQGCLDDGSPFLAMEWLEGVDLAAHLAAGPLPVADAVALCIRVADALGAAHERGVVHRDVKPTNLFVVGGALERVKVLDFGVARRTRASPSTEVGRAVGTPAYMAPEQARGEPDVDARADVWALGCVLFECIAGRPPFEGEHALAVLAKILVEDAPRLASCSRGTPAALDDLVARMLARERASRPRTGAESAVLLAGFGTLGSGAPQAGGARKLTPSERRMLSLVLAVPPGAHTSIEVGLTLPALDRETHEDVQRAVARHQGRLEQLADGTLAVSVTARGGASDQVVQAARCALSLRPLLPDATLVVATGPGTASQRWPVGEVLDRALALSSRAQRDVASAAPPSGPGILVCDLTAGLLDARFELDTAGRLSFLRREHDGFDVARTLLRRPSRFFGRQRELSAILDAYRSAVEDRVPGVVLVTGEAGLGKSRLRQEAARKLREEPSLPEIWYARGDPTSAGSPLSVASDLVHALAGATPGDPPEVRRRLLVDRLTRSLDRVAAERISRPLSRVMGVRSDERAAEAAARHDAELSSDEIQLAFDELVASVCSRQPLVVVLEDLQWGDVASLRLVEGAVRAAGEAPLFVLALARPDVHQAFSRLWEKLGVTRLPLGQLSRRDAAALVRNALGDAISATSCDRIVERAAGHPLFLEELVRATAEGHGDAVPTTVLAMLHARIDRLETDARRILRAASVFGRAFWPGGVAALAGMEEESVRSWLDELVDREIVGRRGAGRFSAEPELLFRHALVRDAAYETLTDSDRALGHVLAGEWLVAMGEPDANVIAEHFDRGKEPQRAAGWYVRAAQQALDATDLDAVLARTQRALRCGPTGAERGRLRRLEGEALVWRGDTVLALDRLEESMSLLDPAELDWFLAATISIVAAGRMGRIEDAARSSELLVAMNPGEPTPLHVVAYGRAAMVMFGEGVSAVGDALLHRARSAARSFPETVPLAEAWVALCSSWSAYAAGAHAEAFELDAAATEWFRRAGDRRSVVRQLANAAFELASHGLYADAEPLVRESVALARAMGLATLAGATQNLSFVLLRLGRLEEARAAALESVAECSRQHVVRQEADSRVYLAAILQESGELADAEVHARRACEIGAPLRPSKALARLASILLARGQVDEALAAATSAVAIIEERGTYQEHHGLARLVHARALQAAGRADEARATLMKAREQLLEQARTIRDERRRAGYLHVVAEHAQILELTSSPSR